MILDECVLYFVLMFQTINRIFIEVDQLLIQKLNFFLDQVPANPYNNHCVILSERKTIIDNKLYVNI